MHNQGHAPAVEKSSPCIARQPIFSADESVVGYELFFREDPKRQPLVSNRESATLATIDMLQTRISTMQAT